MFIVQNLVVFAILLKVRKLFITPVIEINTTFGKLKLTRTF